MIYDMLETRLRAFPHSPLFHSPGILSEVINNQSNKTNKAKQTNKQNKQTSKTNNNKQNKNKQTNDKTGKRQSVSKRQNKTNDK